MSTTTTGNSSLLGLPAELRISIYGFAIGTPVILVDEPTPYSDWQISDLHRHEVTFNVIPSRGLEHCQPSRQHTRPLKTLVELPSTCWQMRNEIGQSAYTHNLCIVEITELCGFIKQIPSSALPVIKTLAVTGNLQDYVDLSNFGKLTALEDIKVMLNFGLKDWHPMSRSVKLADARRLKERIKRECSMDVEVEFVTLSEMFE